MKKIILIPLVLVLIASLIFAYFWIESLFPKVNPIMICKKDEIISVKINEKGEMYNVVSPLDYERICSGIKAAEPTRKMSMNERPGCDTYIVLTVSCSEHEYTYYIYKNGFSYYIELSYWGIYKTDREFYDFLVSIK
jgi:hypothetical protein